MNRGGDRSTAGWRYSSTPGPRGRSSLPHPNHFLPPNSDGVNVHSPLPGGEDPNNRGRQRSWKNLSGSKSRQYEYRPKVNYSCPQDQSSLGSLESGSCSEKLSLDQAVENISLSSSPTGLEVHLSNEKMPSVNVTMGSVSTVPSNVSSPISSPCLHRESSQVNEPQHQAAPDLKANTGHSGMATPDQKVDSDHSELSSVSSIFDICPCKNSKHVVLKAPLFAKNRAKRNESKHSGSAQRTLRSGMVLLKQYLSCADQVKIVKKCRDLGVGSGGFYQPGYRDGAKLHLNMMCLGKNWEPENGEYRNDRLFDGVKPPGIPYEFHQFVKTAIRDSHNFLKQVAKVSDVERVLPSMTPNICIVNFYTTNGRLGLHQDKDESSESIEKGLPVVSFSIGDSAEFLYGDDRDPDKASKVELESGDVLIFGGDSRRIFHGVTAILAGSAPKDLLDATMLRAGRLNLTFREY